MTSRESSHLLNNRDEQPVYMERSVSATSSYNAHDLFSRVELAEQMGRETSATHRPSLTIRPTETEPLIQHGVREFLV